MLAEPLAVTLQVARVFNQLGLAYLIGGSLASSLHGEPRSTNDADLLAEISGMEVDALVTHLESDFYVDRDMVLDAIRRGASFNVIHLATMFKVDVFVLTRDPLLREEMSRRTSHRVAPDAEQRAFFASPEDTILQKLHWYREGNEIAEQQWRDVLGVLKVQGEGVDRGYLRRWAPHLGVAELLERALAEAGLV